MLFLTVGVVTWKLQTVAIKTSSFGPVLYRRLDLPLWTIGLPGNRRIHTHSHVHVFVRLQTCVHLLGVTRVSGILLFGDTFALFCFAKHARS